jgi:mono/diheme cytochrome c family protein
MGPLRIGACARALAARCTVVSGLAAMLIGLSPATASAQHSAQIARGKYLVEALGGCGDCHTPGSLLGKPDLSRYLAGSDVGWAVPGLGVVVAPNLTPDKETGLGNWTTEQIVSAITTGRTPSGRILAPAMPWQDFAHLTPSDAVAIAVYLQSLKPIKQASPAPFGPDQKVDVLVESVLPPDVYNKLPKPAPHPGAPAGKQ